MRVLVTGAGGMVGGRLAELLSPRFEVVAARHQSPGPAGVPQVPLDLASAPSVERAIEQARPDAIVHAAALADPDRCEREPELAETLNVRACERLARLCRKLGIRLVALSTDLVFRGVRPFANETDPPGPLMTYARTKLLGEEAVLGLASGATVVRLALVHGRGHGPKGSASEAIAWALRDGRRPRLFTDQYRTPVDPESIAAAVERILQGNARGVFHLGGAERLSRHELGLRVARALGIPIGAIDAVRQSEQPLAAQRPEDVSLDSSKAKRELGWTPRPLEHGIREGRPGPG